MEPNKTHEHKPDYLDIAGYATPGESTFSVNAPCVFRPLELRMLTPFDRLRITRVQVANIQIAAYDPKTFEQRPINPSDLPMRGDWPTASPANRFTVTVKNDSDHVQAFACRFDGVSLINPLETGFDLKSEDLADLRKKEAELAAYGEYSNDMRNQGREPYTFFEWKNFPPKSRA